MQDIAPGAKGSRSGKAVSSRSKRFWHSLSEVTLSLSDVSTTLELPASLVSDWNVCQGLAVSAPELRFDGGLSYQNS